MNWQMYALLVFVILSAVGMPFLTVMRITSETFLRSLATRYPFQGLYRTLTDARQTSAETLSKSKSIEGRLALINDELTEIKKELQLTKSTAAGGYEQLYAMLQKGEVIKIDEEIEKAFKAKLDQIKKREAEIKVITEKLLELGDVILKK